MLEKEEFNLIGPKLASICCDKKATKFVGTDHDG